MHIDPQFLVQFLEFTSAAEHALLTTLDRAGDRVHIPSGAGLEHRRETMEHPARYLLVLILASGGQLTSLADGNGVYPVQIRVQGFSFLGQYPKRVRLHEHRRKGVK